MRTPDGTVAGLILAAGHSRRLGRPKQTLPYGSSTLLDHAIAEAEAAEELDPVVVVLPSRELVPDPPVKRAHIVRLEEGGACSSSLHAGLEALPSTISAIAVLPVDQPALDVELISLAARSWLQSRPAALTLSYRGEPGHPLLFSASLLPELRSLHGEKAMWRLLEKLGTEVERVDVDMPLPQDIDTWADYQRIVPGHTVSL